MISQKGQTRKTHGMDGTPTYRVWVNMKQRCLNPNDPAYSDYGGRGIRVCDRWLNSFINFYEDMGEKPTTKSLDRINNNGDYEPSNCRWATPRQQRVNSRSSGQLHIKGVYRHKNKFRARIYFKGKNKSLGVYKNLADAKDARLSAEKELWNGSYL